MEEKLRKIFTKKNFSTKMAKTFHPKIVFFFSLRYTLKRIFMLFPEFTKNQNPTKSDQIRPNPTKFDQVRPNLADSDGIRRSDLVGVARGGTSLSVKSCSQPKSPAPACVVLYRLH